MTLRLGTSKVDITPNIPVELAGFAHREGVYCEINTPLYLKTFYFEKSVSPTEKKTIILITADLIWWDGDKCAISEKSIGEAFDLKDFNIVFHATHNHSGPQTNPSFTKLLGTINSDYIEFLYDQIIEAIKIARQNVEPIKLEKGSTNCKIGINRRLKFNNEIKMAPNDNGVVDPQVIILLIKNLSGKIKGVLIHYACHPTTTGENFVSSEFPGIAADKIEQSLGDQVIAGYLQGCCADIRPALVDKKNNKFYRGEHTDVKRLGNHLADCVLNAIQEQEFIKIESDRLIIRHKAIPLTFKNIPSISYLKNMEGTIRQDPQLEWCSYLLKNESKLKSEVTLELTFVEFGRELSFLAMNAEMVVEYGLLVKKEFSNCVLPIPYSNGMIGYIPTARQIEEGGYEANESIYYFGLPSQFSMCIEDNISQGIRDLIMEGECKNVNFPSSS
ncbi:neutral/alkaline non-lysosomal ceramidase N-terminal domain-containing protein [Pseudalkalibacillus decolorationis]|uniref:neutral/alkaline non-lysosomal ceramidase N-terminal domain-containing protein n=1 Tax=Pseudalkalibacillus decolorationis TaxID=163879 RepID=UPI0021486AC3|nr:neutral/alkaline non-lysosomal ceramidase N-terminal domain-containing protein [Pseudalkalibacillus decolorationis]